MSRSSSALALFLSCAVTCFGCGDDGSPVDTDAGGVSDAGQAPTDGGASSDAGVPHDAHMSIDASMPIDAHMSIDASMPIDAHVEPDAGARDAGQTVDAAVPVDAHMPVDASLSDAGSATRVDSGTVIDAGPGDAGSAALEIIDLGSTGSESLITRSGTLVGAASAQSGTCGGTSGHERVFRVVATYPATWYTSVSASGFTPVIYIRRESTGAEIGCAVNPGDYDFGRDFEAGASYLIFVDATTSATGAFTLTIQQT